MKNLKHYLIVCFMTIIVFTFICCEDDKNNDSPEITREFNDLTFLGKNIKLIDETGNVNDLKARGIWQKINDGLNASTAKPDGYFGIKFYSIYALGNFAIVIEGNKTYTNGFYGLDGYKILFCETQLSEYTAIYIRDCIEAAILDMTLPE